jgi:oligopeptide/dipeptide ABC transporter ATP-binding protein
MSVTVPHLIEPGAAATAAPTLVAEKVSIFLKVGHSRLQVVRDVTFAIAPGEFFALVGESGSGKTVLARSIMRLFPSGVLETEGHLRLQGTDIAWASTRTMRSLRGRSVSMIFQEPMTSLNPLLTVAEQVGETLNVHQKMGKRERDERILELLTDVRFPMPKQVAQMYPHELSGGMRQRVMIAIALANNPALIIADEPTTALDVTIQQDIMEILVRLKEAYRLSVLFISHDLSLVHRYADRVGVLYGGVLMEQGPVREVIEHPAHPYTKALLDCVPRARVGSVRQDGIEGTVPRIQEWFDGCRFAARCVRCMPDCTQGAIPLVPVGEHREARCLYPY